MFYVSLNSLGLQTIQLEVELKVPYFEIQLKFTPLHHQHH